MNYYDEIIIVNCPKGVLDKMCDFCGDLKFKTLGRWVH